MHSHAETVYNFYNLPNVEQAAVGCSQVDVAREGTGKMNLFSFLLPLGQTKFVNQFTAN